MFERYGANMVINATVKKYFYKTLTDKFQDVKEHTVDKYKFTYNNQSFIFYHLHKEGNVKTIFRYHPILNRRIFDICNHLKNFNIIAVEIENGFKSIYQYVDLNYKLFENCCKQFNLTKENTYIMSSCAYTYLGLSLAEKYTHLYNKYIIEEPMIDFHKTINRSIKQIRFITPLLSKQLYPS